MHTAEIILNDVELRMPNGMHLTADEIVLTVDFAIARAEPNVGIFHRHVEDWGVAGPVHINAFDDDDRQIRLTLPATDPLIRTLCANREDYIVETIMEG